MRISLNNHHYSYIIVMATNNKVIKNHQCNDEQVNLDVATSVLILTTVALLLSYIRLRLPKHIKSNSLYTLSQGGLRV